MKMLYLYTLAFGDRGNACQAAHKLDDLGASRTQDKSLSAVFWTFVQRIGSALWQSYLHARRHRESMKALAHLDDRMLRDIGISRTQANAVVNGWITLEQLELERSLAWQKRSRSTTTAKVSVNCIESTSATS